MDRMKTLLGALQYMQEVDPNGTWDEAAERVAHFEIVENDDIAYTIETLNEWQSELEEGDRMKAVMVYWMDRLKVLI